MGKQKGGSPRRPRGIRVGGHGRTRPRTIPWGDGGQAS